MQKWFIAPLALVLVLAACDGNPFVEGDETGGSGGDDTDTNAVTIDSEVSKNVTKMSYNGTTLKLAITGVTATNKMATFTAIPSRDVAGTDGAPDLKAYYYQEDAGARYYLAYVATNANNSIVSVAASDGGQLNQHNGGGQVYRVTTYTKPTEDGADAGYFRYAGSYAGVFVPGTAADPTQNPGLRPNNPMTVTGTIVMNADFANNQVEGGVVDRRMFNPDGTQRNTITINNGGTLTTYDLSESTVDTADDWPDLVLRATDIDSSGTFLGTVEHSGTADSEQGKFAGAFGGSGASDIAGVLWVHPLVNQDGVWEYGAFNLPACGEPLDPATSPVCSLITP